MTNLIMEDLERRMGELRRGLLGGDLGDLRGVRIPAVDLVDEGREFVLTAELPGVEKRNLEIEVADAGIRILAKTAKEVEVRAKGWIRHERSGASYERFVALPQRVDPGAAKATLENGVLSVKIPKKDANEARVAKLKIE